MNNFVKVKNKYVTLANQTIENNKQILIDSFAEFYGEKYRKLIEHRINEIIFVYYIDIKVVKDVFKYLIPNSNYKKYLEYIEFYKCYYSIFNLFNIRKLDTFIGSSDNDEFILNFLEEFFKNNQIDLGGSFNLYKNGTKRYVYFQLFASSAELVIHEINHAITRELLVEIQDDEKYNKIEKAGIHFLTHPDYGNNLYFEELLNDKSSIEISKIFHKNGGDFSKICFDLPTFEYLYRKNFYLIDYFYETFKNHINEARISENNNEIIQRIGEENYYEFMDFVNSHFSIDDEEIKKYTNESSKVDILIKRMKDYYQQNL